jgi:hypothetical protein
LLPLYTEELEISEDVIGESYDIDGSHASGGLGGLDSSMPLDTHNADDSGDFLGNSNKSLQSAQSASGGMGGGGGSARAQMTHDMSMSGVSVSGFQDSLERSVDQQVRVVSANSANSVLGTVSS